MADQRIRQGFPSINLMTHRQQVISGHKPLVRVPFWLGLIAATLLLIAVMAAQLLPSLLVPR
jgi:hypothetical protein